MSDQAVTAETIKKADMLQHDVQRGRHAAEILGNPVWHEAFVGMKAALMARLVEVNLQDAEGVMLTVQRLKLVDLVRAEFESFVSVGRSAEQDIKRQQEVLKRQQAELDQQNQHFFGRGLRRAQHHLRNAREATTALDDE